MEELHDEDSLYSFIETLGTETDPDLCDDSLLSFLTPADLEYFPVMSPEETQLDLCGLAKKYDLRFPDLTVSQTSEDSPNPSPVGSTTGTATTPEDITEKRGKGKKRAATLEDITEKRGKGKKRTKKKHTRSDSERFRSVSEEELSQLSTPYVPKNTNRSTAWAKSVFDAWMANREEKCPPSFLETCRDPRTMEKWLKLFVAEAMFNKNGEPYPPDTIYSILTGILRYMRQATPRCSVPNFLDRKNPDFAEVHSVTDHIYRQLRMKGIGASRKATEVLTKDEENTLWERGVLGVHTPQALLNATFFLNGKNLALRGGKEHHELKFTQFQRLVNPDRYVYTENGSKNRSGGIADFRVPNKVVTIHMNRHSPDRCHVRILDAYISRVPDLARQFDAFYLQSMSSADCGIPGAPWYKQQRIGINKLQGMVKNMCLQAGIPGNKTNHSLRAACATQLYEAGIPEKLIQDRTGHRSLSSLRRYEKPSEMQLRACGDVLDSTHAIKFQSYEKDYANKENTDPSTVQPTKSGICADYANKENTDPPTVQPIKSGIHASKMSPTTPQRVDKGARSVNLTNCQIQINLAPRTEKLDDFDTLFKDDLHVFDCLGHYF